MPSQYPKQQRDRAVRMVVDHLAEYGSVYLACKAIGGEGRGRGGVAASVGEPGLGRYR